MSLAKLCGLDVVALTDHDTVEGWQQAAEMVSTTGVALVRGAEFSTSHDSVTAHVLGYLFDPEDQKIKQLFTQIKRSRIRRLKAITQLVNQDYPITWEQVLAQGKPGVAIGRPHLADALIEAGYFHTRAEVFDQVLHPSRPYYLRYQAVDTFEAVEAINQAGGVAVLAHPRAKARQRRFLEAETIRKLKSAGLFALEVDHPEQDLLSQQEVSQIALSCQLAQTGGSDFHGNGKENRLGDGQTAVQVLEEIAAKGGLPVLWP